MEYYCDVACCGECLNTMQFEWQEDFAEIIIINNEKSHMINGVLVEILTLFPIMIRENECYVTTT